MNETIWRNFGSTDVVIDMVGHGHLPRRYVIRAGQERSLPSEYDDEVKNASPWLVRMGEQWSNWGSR